MDDSKPPTVDDLPARDRDAQDHERRKTRTALAIQSWQLRQLLPSARRTNPQARS